MELAAAGAPSSTRQAWRLCLVLALLPTALAVAQLGRLHPDEVYQFLEPAYWKVHGYGVLAWEWRLGGGLRNWAIPGLLALPLWVAKELGVSHPVAYRALVALPQLLLALCALRAVHRYARRRTDEAGAKIATLAFGLCGTVVVFSGRTLGESFSAALLVIALERLDAASRWAPFVAGLMLGGAVVARYGSAPVAVIIVAYLAFERRWRACAWCVAGGALVAAGLGVLDWLTWGQPFHSLGAYVRFNLLSGEAARQFGASPARFYALPMLVWTPLWVWLASLFAVRRGDGLPFVAAAGYLAALLATPHKEERFLYPAVVMLTFVTAPWVYELSSRWARVRPAGVWAALLLSLAPVAFMPDVRGDEFRAIVRATRDEDARGLLIVNEGIWGAGGYFYIGKRIPWLTADWPTDEAFRSAVTRAEINRAVTFEDRALDALAASGFREVERIGRATVLGR